MSGRARPAYDGPSGYLTANPRPGSYSSGSVVPWGMHLVRVDTTNRLAQLIAVGVTTSLMPSVQRGMVTNVLRTCGTADVWS